MSKTDYTKCERIISTHEECEFPNKAVLGAILYGEPNFHCSGMSYQFINFLRVLEGYEPSYVGNESGDYVRLWAVTVINKHFDYLDNMYKAQGDK